MAKFRVDFSHHYSVVVEADDAAQAAELVGEGDWGEPGPEDMGMDQHRPIPLDPNGQPLPTPDDGTWYTT